MRITLIASAVLLLASFGVAPASAKARAGRQDDHPLQKDKTGLTWVLPFTKALKTAEDGNRLLMIKPVAFGTDKAGGW